MNKFESGDYAGALIKAKILEGYTESSGSYLYSQFMVYGAMQHGRDMYAIKESLRKLDKVPANDGGEHLMSFVLAKGFAKVYLYNPTVAKTYVDGQCKKMGVSINKCVNGFLKGVMEAYLSVHRRFDSVLLYEVADFSGETNLIDQASANFLRAISIRFADRDHSNYVLRGMVRDGTLTKQMQSIFCENVRYLKDDAHIINCSPSMNHPAT
ncbi:hypothetical protein GCM10027285_01260 [Oleiagrimonas citrea]